MRTLPRKNDFSRPERAIPSRRKSVSDNVIAICAEAADSYPELYGEALEAYRQNDVEAFGASVRRMLEVRPQYPTALYFNAIYYTRADRHDDALGTLASLAAMGLDFPVAEEKDLAALKQYADFPCRPQRFLL